MWNRKRRAGRKKKRARRSWQNRKKTRRARAEERALHRMVQEEILAELRAERAQREALTARVLELTEHIVNRANGNRRPDDNGATTPP